MKNFLQFLLTITFIASSLAQNNAAPISTNAATNKTPKLVVGIVVDQMRVDYLYRYYNKYGENGFKKLLNNGSFFANTHYNYVPTVTAPGHAAIYTGATPAINGIVGNYWYDIQKHKRIYCVADPDAKAVGLEPESTSHKVSAKNCVSSTIGDELKIASNGKSKVFGVSQKDRAAILPAGHAADGAYWLDGNSGKFITSTYYQKQLPKWLIEFNQTNLPAKYLKNGWNTLLPINQYTESIADDNNYEKAINKTKPTFPYSFENEIAKNDFKVIASTPYGNTLTKDVAIELILKENLGQSNQTDFLSISFSSTDIIGHDYGIRSIEVEDTYLRLDKDMEDLMNMLEAKIGKDNFVLFLTADHGGAENWQHLNDNKIPGGRVEPDLFEDKVKALFNGYFGDSLLLFYENNQLFLNDESIQNKKIDLNDVLQKLNLYIKQGNLEGVSAAYLSGNIMSNSYESNEILSLVKKGLYMKRAGQIVLTYDPAYNEWGNKGTTHESGFSYDTHVPLLFYGKNMKAITYYEKINITQIAPTVSFLLNISKPNGCLDEPIYQVLERK
jgi:predicted AlkP superfamily pyrophosphatase or phosphodiesterase